MRPLGHVVEYWTKIQNWNLSYRSTNKLNNLSDSFPKSDIILCQSFNCVSTPTLSLERGM